MFSIALRIILYDKVRTLITLIGVVFAVALIFAQIGIYLGLMETASLIIDRTPGDIWITSKNNRNFDFSMPFPELKINRVLTAEGVKNAEKLIVTWGVIKQPQGGTEQVEIVGYNPDTGIGGPWEMKAGDVRDVKSGNYIIVDASSMKRLGMLEKGDHREIMSRRLKVVGISQSVKSFTTAPIVFTSYKTAQHIGGYVGEGETVFIIANVFDGYPVKDVVERLREALPGLDVYSKDEFSKKTRLYWTIETGVGFSFLITILISFFIGMLIVGQMIYNSTVEYLKEFGTLKAIGAANIDIYKIIFSEALINAILGYVISLMLTLASVKVYKTTEMVFTINTEVAALVFLITLVMCVFSAFISVRKIRRIDPALVFRG
ncbi:MAG: FtsX-like permease family protein [Nitrospirae bacterium]|nr:FtsX-like permease family protein [Nitrospirota bacterium]